MYCFQSLSSYTLINVLLRVAYIGLKRCAEVDLQYPRDDKKVKGRFPSSTLHGVRVNAITTKQPDAHDADARNRSHPAQ